MLCELAFPVLKSLEQLVRLFSGQVHHSPPLDASASAPRIVGSLQPTLTFQQYALPEGICRPASHTSFDVTEAERTLPGGIDEIAHCKAWVGKTSGDAGNGKTDIPPRLWVSARSTAMRKGQSRGPAQSAMRDRIALRR